MIQATRRGLLAGLLRLWRSQRSVLDKRVVVPSGAIGVRGFTWAVLIFFLGAVAVTAVQLWLSVGARFHPPVVPEAIYFAGLAAVICSRASRYAGGIIAYAVMAIALCILLDAVTHGDWGNIGLYAMIVTVVYILPLRISLPLFSACAVVILISEGVVDLLLGRQHVNGNVIISQTLIIGFAFAASLSQRSRHLFTTRLERTQAQLREEMDRTAELAAARERARIARDVHDVLAHSLTVLSVQVQALRQLLHDQPERAAGMLDQMAEVLRESQAESRQIVGLLREALPEEEAAESAARLRVTAERFAERTGIRCALCEHGSPTHLSTQHVETLRFALQEALTNAYRHGRASHATADLWWEGAAVRLTVRDDGTGAKSDKPDERAGNGLRGMRERAEALGGVITTGPRTDSVGFEISMTLPVPEGQLAVGNDAVSWEVGNTGERIA